MADDMLLAMIYPCTHTLLVRVWATYVCFGINGPRCSQPSHPLGRGLRPQNLGYMQWGSPRLWCNSGTAVLLHSTKHITWPSGAQREANLIPATCTTQIGKSQSRSLSLLKLTPQAKKPNKTYTMNNPLNLNQSYCTPTAESKHKGAAAASGPTLQLQQCSCNNAATTLRFHWLCQLHIQVQVPCRNDETITDTK
jgi:hypothetical protein